jgi:hypothetical protein
MASWMMVPFDRCFDELADVVAVPLAFVEQRQTVINSMSSVESRRR